MKELTHQQGPILFYLVVVDLIGEFIQFLPSELAFFFLKRDMSFFSYSLLLSGLIKVFTIVFYGSRLVI